MYKMLGWNSRKTNERFKLVTESLKFNQQTSYLDLAQKPLCEFLVSENTGFDSITVHLSGGGCGLGVCGGRGLLTKMQAILSALWRGGLAGGTF